MRQSQTVTLPGINIQAPWAEAIVSGRKVIETRFYPMPRSGSASHSPSLRRRARPDIFNGALPGW